MVSLITDGDESAYRKNVEQLVFYSSNNHLPISTQKTVEMVVDFRCNHPPSNILTIGGSVVLRVWFLGTTWAENLLSETAEDNQPTTVVC